MSTNGDYYHRCSVFIAMILILIHFFLHEESELEEENGKKFKTGRILLLFFLFTVKYTESSAGPSNHINKTKWKQELTSYMHLETMCSTTFGTIT